MIKISLLAASAALAFATAAPLAAQEVSADPFVSTAGPALGLTPGLIAAGIAVTIIGIAAIDSSDDT
ncbi:hypothetical protein OO012_10430 [Rhodobacteraceae bacterium KMM 6894]|nr:hypothetical protein [Rhodobacteraceae bacterium KMM 6894]